MESSFKLFAVYGDGTESDAGPITRMQFPGGERHIRLPHDALEMRPNHWELVANIYDPAGVVDLLLIDAALNDDPRTRYTPIVLTLPYLPFARQDRVAVAGEPNSAARFCQVIERVTGFGRIRIADPHSKAALSGFKLLPVEVMPAANFVRMLKACRLAEIQKLAVIAPDAGAMDRASEAAKAIGADVIQATKKRDPTSGKLSAPEIGDLPELPLLIVDDICDGGGTFIQLAQEIRKKSSQPLYLYVTHGLFTKGLEPLLEHFDGVFAAYCANPEHAQATSIL